MYLVYAKSFSLKIITLFRHEKFGSFSVYEPVKLMGNVKTFLCIDNIYFCFFISTAISIPQMHLQVIPSDCCPFAKCYGK